MSSPEPVDPEIAAATFREHLDQFFAVGRGTQEYWSSVDLDSLHSVIQVPAIRASGEVDLYHVKLGAEYYDVWPPVVTFVAPTEDGEWEPARGGSKYWPKQNNSPGFSFGLHPSYSYPDGMTRQLACFSHSFDYYISNHTPNEGERWRQGVHTVSATLTRLAQALSVPNYQGPSGDSDS